MSGGRFYWAAATDRIYAFGADNSWISVTDTWVEGRPEYTCTAGRNAGVKRGFGIAWCENSSIQTLLGKSITNEYAVGITLATFENGLIIRAEGVTRVVYNDGTWETR